MTKAFQDILTSNDIYKPDEIDIVLSMAFDNAQVVNVSNKKQYYYNIPCAFDIETSSFYVNGNEKRACMYMWSLCLNGYVIIGRTWPQAIKCFDTIARTLKLDYRYHLIIYVHNLSYEFQFLRKWLKWSKVFAISNRKPVYAMTENGLEFRCSYLLSGYSLAGLSDQLHKYKVRKLSGALDYKLARHTNSFLTGKEIAYSANDVKVVTAYIQEQIEIEENITVIPITKTGYVRRYCRTNCFYTKGIPRKKSFKRLHYMDLMAGMTLTPDVYRQLKRAFQGGFTHANAFYSGLVVDNVASYDFTSSYPTVMLAEKFPMSSAEDYTPKDRADFNRQLKLYCCLFDIRLTGLKPKRYHENYISISRCWGVKKPVINNGRVVSADELYTTITEQDFLIINAYYTWDHMAVSNFRRFKKDYLPRDFVKSILDLYVKKTELKGVEGLEVEYMLSKGMINACYGMTVTDIVREENKYKDDEWQEPVIPDLNKEILKYNRSSSRFLYYPWGVWTTAYARRNLFTGISEFGMDYIYSDTDSIKVINAENHQEYINRYNETIINQLEKAMDYHRLPKDSIRPKTIKGVEKPLGIWDYEGKYSRFKTLGAKRYMVEQDGKINITVSGLNKKVTVPYITKQGNDTAFNDFSADLYVPPEATGKNTHTYIDEEIAGLLTDYLGRPGPYWELSFIHLEEADYSLSLSQEYADYILSVQEVEAI